MGFKYQWKILPNMFFQVLVNDHILRLGSFRGVNVGKRRYTLVHGRCTVVRRMSGFSFGTFSAWEMLEIDTAQCPHQMT